jgi:hypothetical protein
MALCLCPLPAAARTFDFLYIDANEGSASGGHAAIRFDNEIFHFQHIESGLLRLYRDDFAAFRLAYGYQENRTIHGHRIEVSEDFFRTLHNAFNRRLLIQNQQLAALQAMQDDLVVTAGLQTPESRPTIALKALGYFLDRYRPTFSRNIANADTRDASPQLRQLQQRIASAYGEDFLRRKRQQTWERLQTLMPTLPANTANPIADDRFDPGALVFAQHYQNQLLNLAALDVLQAAVAPRPDTLLQSRLPAFKLNAGQIATLNRFRQKLFADLVRLMHSERPDWGYPLLVGMARLHTLDASIASGYLVVLDRSHKTDTDKPSTSIDAEALPAALQYTQRLFAAANSRLADPAPLDERGYAEIEQSITALLQVHGLSDRGQAGKLPALTNTPSLPATADLVSLPLASEALESYRNAVDERLESYREQLASVYGYNLISRNCVTEIFRLINETLNRQIASASQNPTRLAEESRRLLGGYIDDGGLNMIPFAAFDRVGSQYRLHSSYRLASYRETQLSKLYSGAPEWLVDLQESNLLSATIYDWNGDDAAFLFFTQDAVWPRPLQGGMNLAVATGQAAYGLLSWPWDAGHQLQKSLKGVAVSIPELLFFNIRKGSFPRLLPDAVQDAE